MKFIVVEGIDGSGKSTQIKYIMEHLEKQGVPYRYVHFPRTDSRIYGELIARFLRGDFGDLNTVDPYLVALIYAGDRNDAAPMIREWLNKGYLVLLDRYVYSNIAFQCAKITDPEKREALSKWILDLEFSYHAIPKPDVNILLDVPFSFTKMKLTVAREGQEREYLQGLRDIHEEDLDFQQRVRDMYIGLSKSCQDLKVISCVDDEGGMLAPEIIFAQILKQIVLPS